MRTIQLTEHRSTAEQLTDEELRELDMSGLVTVSPRRDGRFDVRADSRVGTVVMRRIRILVRPKAPIANVMFLMSHVDGIARWDDRRFPYETSEDLASVIATLYVSAVERARRFGLMHDYQLHSEPLPTIRGRVDWGRQLRRQRGVPVPVHCLFEDYAADIEVNRVLLAAARRLGRLPDLDCSVRRRLRHLTRDFDGVTVVEYAADDVPDVRVSPGDESWSEALRIACLILRGGALRDKLGDHPGITFVLDMNLVFESFLGRVIRDEARKRGVGLTLQARRRLTGQIGIRPDFVLTRAGHDIGVADAKYKLRSGTSRSEGDHFQLLAYCIATGLSRGLLVYADAMPIRTEHVHSAGIELQTAGLDLTGTPSKILKSAESLAHWFLDGSAGVQR